MSKKEIVAVVVCAVDSRAKYSINNAGPQGWFSAANCLLGSGKEGGVMLAGRILCIDDAHIRAGWDDRHGESASVTSEEGMIMKVAVNGTTLEPQAIVAHEMLAVREAAQFFRVPVSTIYKLVRLG